MIDKFRFLAKTDGNTLMETIIRFEMEMRESTTLHQSGHITESCNNYLDTPF